MVPQGFGFAEFKVDSEESCNDKLRGFPLPDPYFIRLILTTCLCCFIL